MYATYSTSQFIYTSLQSPTHHDKRQSEQNQEMEITLHSLSYPKLPKPPSCSTPSSSPPLFHSSVTFLGFNRLPTNLQSNLLIKPKQQRKFGVVHASEAQSTSPDDGEKWLLEPVGDGDSRHIGFKVALPGALEISSGVVTVGRVPEKADVVIPVATVSALHARIQKKEGSLLVTDLDSTNGTFIDDKRLSPGVATTVSPGRCITFGDTNLAMFRVLKLENTKASGEAVESESEIGAAVPSNNAESTS